MKNTPVRGVLFAFVYAVFIAGCCPSPSPGPEPRSIVIVHGAWGGGWQFHKIEPLLEEAGHTVYRPTMTGLGERVHLASPAVGLSTHIEDIVNVLEFEDLEDVVLVGHSYGGMVITGVANRVPHRIAKLVFLDAILPEDGESVADLFGDAFSISPTGTEDHPEPWQLVPQWVEEGEKPPVDVPQPTLTFTEPIILDNPQAAQLPAAYIHTIEAGKDSDLFDPFADRARARGWQMVVMEGGHNPQKFQPETLAEVLLQIVEEPTRP